MRPLISHTLKVIAVIGVFAAQLSLSATDEKSNDEDRRPMLDFGNPCNNPVQTARDPNSKATYPAVLPERPLAQPVYPPYAKRFDQEGTVMLDVFVTDAGRIGEVRLNRSSGWPLLDNAAMEGAREWILKPGEQGGKPICSWASVPIVFKLEDYSAEELAVAIVTPQAESVARSLLGEDVMKDFLEKGGSRNDDSLMEFGQHLVASLTSQPKWRESVHQIAAMLSIEMTPEEISVVDRQFSTPEMRKFMGLAHKLGRSQRRAQQQISAVASCTIGLIEGSARKKAGIDLFEDELPKGVVEHLPAFVDALQPYCTCVADNLQVDSNSQNALDHCNAPPALSW